MFGKVLVGAFLVYLVWQYFDRMKHPEKWEAIDEKAKAASAAKKAAKKAQEYQKAMERVPASQWMRMSKHQKADVLERREKATKNRP